MLCPEDRVSICACLIQSIKRVQGTDCAGALWTMWGREFKRPDYGALHPFYAGTAEERQELKAAKELYAGDAVGSLS